MLSTPAPGTVAAGRQGQAGGMLAPPTPTSILMNPLNNSSGSSSLTTATGGSGGMFGRLRTAASNGSMRNRGMASSDDLLRGDVAGSVYPSQESYQLQQQQQVGYRGALGLAGIDSSPAFEPPPQQQLKASSGGTMTLGRSFFPGILKGRKSSSSVKRDAVAADPLLNNSPSPGPYLSALSPASKSHGSLPLYHHPIVPDVSTMPEVPAAWQQQVLGRESDSPEAHTRSLSPTTATPKKGRQSEGSAKATSGGLRNFMFSKSKSARNLNAEMKKAAKQAAQEANLPYFPPVPLPSLVAGAATTATAATSASAPMPVVDLPPVASPVDVASPSSSLALPTNQAHDARRRSSFSEEEQQQRYQQEGEDTFTMVTPHHAPSASVTGTIIDKGDESDIDREGCIVSSSSAGSFYGASPSPTSAAAPPAHSPPRHVMTGVGTRGGSIASQHSIVSGSSQSAAAGQPLSRGTAGSYGARTSMDTDAGPRSCASSPFGSLHGRGRGVNAAANAANGNRGGSISSMASSGSASSIVSSNGTAPSLAPINFRNSFAANMEEALRSSSSSIAPRSSQSLERHTREPSQSSERSSFSRRSSTSSSGGPIIMRRTSSANALAMPLPPTSEEDDAAFVTAPPSSDSPGEGLSNAAADRTITRIPEVYSTPRSAPAPTQGYSYAYAQAQSFLNEQSTGKLDVPSSTSASSSGSKRVASITGQLASQLATMPSLTSMLDQCVPKQRVAAAPTGTRTKKLNDAKRLTEKEYWKAYCDGKIYLNDSEQPDFVAEENSTRARLSIKLASVSPVVDGTPSLGPAKSPTELRFPRPPVRMDLDWTPPTLRPPTEDERNASAQMVLDAIATTAHATQRLNGILERLGGALKVKDTRIELIVNDEVIPVARVTSGKAWQWDELMATPRPPNSPSSPRFPPARERKASLAAHAILAPAETSIVVSDVLLDWRFKHLEVARSMRFYAGIGIMDAYNHAIAAISLYDTAPRDGLSLGQEKLVMLAAQEAAAEILAFRRSAMQERLALMDESIRSWAYCPPGSEPFSASMFTSSSSGSSPGRSIAERRNTKLPSSLTIVNDKSSNHPEQKRLQRAVDTIAERLGVSTVYIASITSDPLETVPIVFSKKGRLGVNCLDAPLHLCTLATGRQGLSLHGERAAQLTGAADCRSAFTVRCSTEEEEKSGKCTDGWVLGLVATDHFDFQAQEISLYLQRFAGLLGVVLGAGGPQQSRTSTSRPMRSPLRLVSAKDQKQGKIRVIPLASPPPTAPLPLPPLSASLKTNQLPFGHVLNAGNRTPSKPLSPPPSTGLPPIQLERLPLRNSKSFGAVGKQTKTARHSEVELENVLHLDRTNQPALAPRWGS